MLAGTAPAAAQPAASARQVIQPDDQDELQWAASVVSFRELSRQGQLTVKLFGTAGGDPAMNGLQTYIAFYQSPGDGWRIFRIGDFLDYRLVSERPGQVVLALRESTMSDAGVIGERNRRVTLSWRVAGDTVPDTIMVR